MMSPRRMLVVLAVLALVALAVVVANRLSRGGDPIVPVARARTGPFESWIATNGVIEPADPRILRARVAAFVDRVEAVEGRPVRRNERLLTLDVSPQRAELARAREELAKAENDLRVEETGGPQGERAQVESDLHKAEAEVAYFRRQRDATARLVAQQAATRDDLENADLAVARADATREVLATRAAAFDRARARNLDLRRLGVQRARDTVQVLQTAVASAEVRSPIDGIVYMLPVRPGTRVEAGAIVAAIADLRSVQLRAFVDEPELAGVAEGQHVEVSWSAVPTQTWSGRTERLPKAIVSRGDRHVGEVVCSIENEDQQLIPNLNVDVRIRVRARPSALVVPRAAVRSDPSGRYVFVVRDDVVRRQRVVVDAASATNYAIASGLEAGDAVALPATTDLRDGMHIHPAPVMP